ncbi:hypothetical protein HPB50_022914 [Hyalomma asiaticum]|uniref:Uncharacterized protein n=1 Tax=Hyalomma asiaticum TaxID=266040 RepID=A0ACB7SGK6_HYAAI|nr:hypothetical protein HPB50_022914 [Hyalomma asiaticum]
MVTFQSSSPTVVKRYVKLSRYTHSTSIGSIVGFPTGTRDVSRQESSHHKVCHGRYLRSGMDFAKSTAYDSHFFYDMLESRSIAFFQMDIYVSPPVTAAASGPTIRERASSRLRQCPVWLPFAILGTVGTLATLGAIFQWRSGSTRCSTDACVAFAKLLKSSMNSSVNPCDSFGRFVCDGWRLTSSLSVRALYYKNALDVLMRTAKSRDVPINHQNAPQQAAALLATCDRVKRGEQDELDVVKQYLAEAGVLWPERAANPNVIDSMLYLDVELNWSAFLHFRQASSADHPVVIIAVANSFYGIRRAIYQFTGDSRRSYFDMLYKHYTGRATSDNVVFEEVLEADVATAPLNELLQKNPWTWVSNEEFFPSAADWRNALSRSLGLTLPADVRYVTDNKLFVTHFFNLWRRLGDRKMHRCISWHAAQYAALSANSELLYNIYGNELKEKGLEFRKLCLVLSYKSMGDLVFTGFTDALPFSRFRDDARALVYAVRRGFANRIAHRQPFSRNVNLVARWSSVEPVFAVLDHNLHMDYRKPAPGFPDMNKTHFVPNWRIMAKAWRSHASVKGKLEINDILGYGFFSVDWNNEDFVLSPFALSFPLYDVELTPALKYGGLGSQVALASAVVLLYHYRKHAHNDSDTAAYLQNARGCVNRSLQGMAHPENTVLTELASLEALADAFQGDSGNDFALLLSGLEQYTEMQMFFIAWCFIRCGERTAGGENFDVDPCSHVLRHVRRFSEAFKCSPGTFLNRDTKCGVF